MPSLDQESGRVALVPGSPFVHQASRPISTVLNPESQSWDYLGLTGPVEISRHMIIRLFDCLLEMLSCKLGSAITRKIQ